MAKLTNSNNILNLTISSLLFSTNAGAFTLQGRAVSLIGGITNNSSKTQTINFAAITNNIDNTIDAASNNIVINSAIVGTGGITKAGAGTSTLTGANTFTGSALVTAGTLAVANTTGSALGSVTNVSVSSGATLLVSQNNQVNNAATVALSGGTIRTGAGVTETFGNLTVSSASFLDFGATSGNASSMNFGTYTPSALLTIGNFDFGSTLTFKTDLTTSITNSSLFAFNNGGISSFNWDAGTSTFTITAIPEPSTVLAAAGLVGLMFWPSRRRLLAAAKGLALRA